MEIMSLVERAGAGTGVEVDLRAQDAAIAIRSRQRKSHPTAAARRDNSVDPRRRAGEVVGERRAELACARIEAEAERGFDVVIEDAEDRSQRRGRRTQISADSVENQERVVAVSPGRNVRESERSRNTVVTGRSIEDQIRGLRILIAAWQSPRVESRERLRAKVSGVTSAELDILIADQAVEADRAPRVRIHCNGDEVAAGPRIKVGSQKARRLIRSQTEERISDRAARAIHLLFVDGASCSVADSFLCLTPNQTTSLLVAYFCGIGEGITEPFAIVITVVDRYRFRS